MRCPSCRESFKDKVVDSRTTDGGIAIRRRRQCLVCGRRFTTTERIEGELRITVIKRSGNRVPYDRQKIIHGLRHACYKLPIDDTQIEKIVDQIEEDIFEVAPDRPKDIEILKTIIAGKIVCVASE